MRSGVDLKISGLNITHEVLITLADAEAMRAYRPNHPRTEFLADVMVHFASAYQDVFFTEAIGPLHDPCAVLVLTHPHLFTMERRHVDVELTGSLTRGMTVMDHRGVKHGPIPNASVAMGVDGPAAAAVILETLRILVDRP